LLPDCLARQGGQLSSLFYFEAIFSLPRGSIENWMPVKCQRVSKILVGAKCPDPALADSSIWGSESTSVDLDLKNPVEECAWVVFWLLNVKCWNVGGLL
jgi:hypothetical protein